jgi:large subunit ribosomal protein L25
MTKHELKVQTRSITGRKVKKLRSGGVIPGNVFGKNIPSVLVQVDVKLFSKTFLEAGESSLIYLSVDSDKATRPVFVSQVTKNPMTGDLQHVSFHQVDLKEKVTAPVPVVLVGEPAAEKEKLGIMVQQIDEIEIEALPTDMPENIHVDVTGLSAAGENIAVKDIVLDRSKLEVKTDPTTIIVQIEALAKEEVAPASEVVGEGEDSSKPTSESESSEAQPARSGSAPKSE